VSAHYLPLSQLSSLDAAALGEWQGAQWLCIDELALVVGRVQWERELFALYRDCEERGASLVMAAREVPAQLPFALPDLGSRCAAGQRLGLIALDELEQCAALRLRAQQRGFDLPEETARYLQRRLPRDMASLFAVLDELDTAALAAQRRVTVPFIRAALARR
jgi:DnaA family protein